MGQKEILRATNRLSWIIQDISYKGLYDDLGDHYSSVSLVRVIKTNCYNEQPPNLGNLKQ